MSDITPELTADERLAQIRDRNRRLTAIAMDTSGANRIMRDMIDSIGDVQWLLEQLKPEYGVRREGSDFAVAARDEATARKRADMYSQIREPGCLSTPHHVTHRLATGWQRVGAAQQAEDGDRG